MSANNPLAFPAHISGTNSAQLGFEGEQLSDGMMVDYSGMYLRDYFAAKALTISLSGPFTIEQKAREAYRIADAMLAERAKEAK